LNNENVGAIPCGRPMINDNKDKNADNIKGRKVESDDRVPGQARGPAPTDNRLNM
jgi:hypothetical protein